MMGLFPARPVSIRQIYNFQAETLRKDWPKFLDISNPINHRFMTVCLSIQTLTRKSQNYKDFQRPNSRSPSSWSKCDRNILTFGHF
ncbi:unnamed protein product [Larinioides sclopetarius]|uniref:Uncharacterized protein n=1 Tax=Larinioides sclopetarius TaxID=280406 RepID=A0AAV2A2E4_9ARAC